jgi:hypothetical protein
MGRLGRDLRQQKLAKLLGHANDESMLWLVATVVALLDGRSVALGRLPDFPKEALGAEIGSPHYIAPWTLETFVNELLSAPKHKLLGTPNYRVLRHDRFQTLRNLTSLIIALENAEDGLFLEKNDIFTEMHRLGQRQFPWQRGMGNGPALYRSLLLYGTGSAADHFAAEAGITVGDFVKVGAWLSGVLGRSDQVDRFTDLSTAGITPDQRAAALARFAIGHAEARLRARKMRSGNLHTAYKPSILRDFPVIAFGERGERLRAPIPSLIMQRFTTGLYLDVVGGGPAVWTEIGERFERYCVDYLSAMLAPYSVAGERSYGPKKARFRTPDVLVSDSGGVVLVAECKAKRMTFGARFAEDPVADAATGYGEIAKGVFQIWRFLSHARQGLDGAPPVHPDCIGILLTVDPWLTMARNQEEQVIAAAHALADAAGGIEQQDRRHVPVCVIDDVEFALQNGTPESFFTACRDLSTEEKKGWILSVAHAAVPSGVRPFPFLDRIADILPWWSPDR